MYYFRSTVKDKDVRVWTLITISNFDDSLLTRAFIKAAWRHNVTIFRNSTCLKKWRARSIRRFAIDVFALNYFTQMIQIVSIIHKYIWINLIRAKQCKTVETINNYLRKLALSQTIKRKYSIEIAVANF